MQFRMRTLYLGLAIFLLATVATAHEAHRKAAEAKAAAEASAAAQVATPVPEAEVPVGADAAEATSEHEGHSEDIVHEHTVPRGEGLQIGRLHPLFVHFPIALLVMAMVAEIVSRGRPGGSPAAPFMVHTAAGFAVLAAALGLAFAELSTYEGASRELIDRHEFFGLATAALAVSASFFLAWRKGRHRALYLTSLALAAIAVSITGYFGGALVYGIDHFFFWR